MARILRNLSILSVDSVDKAANRHSRVLIRKRDSAVAKRKNHWSNLGNEETDFTPEQAAWLAGNSSRAAGESYEAYLRRIQGPMAVAKNALDHSIKSIVAD